MQDLIERLERASQAGLRCPRCGDWYEAEPDGCEDLVCSLQEPWRWDEGD